MKALVVFCHPTADSLVGAARARAVAGLLAAGHEVREIDLYAENFRPELDRADRDAHLVDHTASPDRRPDIVPHTDVLQWCDLLVFVYPTWWAGLPAMLKGWCDRVLVRGVAWDLPDGGQRIRGRLRNVRRIVAITTHGSSKLTNLVEGEAGKRMLSRSIRAVCHPRCRTTWLALYSVDRSTHDQRRAFLDRVERTTAHLT